jgi:hypothetical protein
MDADYPAAHSMDTVWYAVDDHGHVARFNSGENGHVPEGAPSEEALAQDPLEELWTLRHGSASSEQRPEYISEPEDIGRLGLFDYDYGYDFDPIGPYSREAVPENPLHIDQLPPHLRKLFGQVRFENVNFAESELVQPLEQYDCVYWYEADRVAYLCADGVTVHPIPGQEEHFEEFCAAFREQNPEEARRLRFVNPDQEPDD